MMRLEVLYFDGCPNHEALLPRLHELVAEAGIEAEVELRRVEDLETAGRERFLGSPTLRVNGRDVDPSAVGRADFGLKCRLYAGPDGMRGTPADELIRAAINRAHAVERQR